MTRVSSYSQYQALGADLARAQRDLLDLQRQASSQKRAQDIRGYGLDASQVVSVRNALARASAQVDANLRLEQRLEVQDLALGRLADSGALIRQAIGDALAADSAVDFMRRIQSAYSQAVEALNTEYQGQRLFAGATADVRPVPAAAATLDQMAALATVDEAFVHAEYGQTAKIDEATTVEIAPRARDLATDLFTLFRTIHAFNAGPDGPFDGKLTAAQKTFLESQMPVTRDVNVALVDAQSAASGVASQVEGARMTAEMRRDGLEQVAGELQNVDLADLATRLASAQNQFQASAQMINTLRQLTLLDFLR